MERTQFLRQIDELLELDAGTVKGPELLDGFDNWNSLAVIGYMAMVNENYGIIVSPKAIAGCATVNDLVALTQAA